MGVRAPWRVTSSTKRRVELAGGAGNAPTGATHFSLTAAAARAVRSSIADQNHPRCKSCHISVGNVKCHVMCLLRSHRSLRCG